MRCLLVFTKFGPCFLRLVVGLALLTHFPSLLRVSPPVQGPGVCAQLSVRSADGPGATGGQQTLREALVPPVLGEGSLADVEAGQSGDGGWG